jgi:HB1, ASXL, restriction endonuclease HTH domain
MSKTKSTKTAKTVKKAPAKKTKEPKEKKLSAIDAAAQVLASSKEPLNAKEMIEAMAAKGLWSSPGGKTPWATLYSALIREIALKGKEARFVKTERGKFAAKA